MIKYNYKTYFLLILNLIFNCLFFLSSETHASALSLHNDLEHQSIGKHVKYFEDTSAQLDFADIQDKDILKAFKQAHDNTLNFAYTKSAYWLQLEYKDISPANKHWYLEVNYSLLQCLDFYIPDENNNYIIKRMGTDRPFIDRDVSHRSYVIKIPKNNSDKKTLYIRVETSSSMTLPIKIRSVNNFLEHTQIDYLIKGFIYGALLILSIYNFFIFISLRDRYYLYYIVFILGFLIFQSTYDGISSMFLWDSIYNRSVVIASFAITTLSSVFFTVSFLKLKEARPDLLPVAKILILCLSIIILSIPFAEYSLLIIPSILITIVSFIFMLWCGLSIWLKQYKPARFFMAAWAIFSASIIIMLLVRLGFLPSNNFTETAYLIGFILLALLLSFSLSDRISILKQEKERAIKQSLSNSRMNETLINNQKNQLEIEVKERTLELMNQKEAAEDATKLKDKFVSLVAHDLKGPLSALLGYLELINPEDDEQEEILDKVILSGNRQMSMINDVLNISRLQTGKLIPQKENISLYLAVEVALTKYLLSARKKNIEIINHVGKDATIFADEVLLVEVLVNLINNALKFSYSGDRIKISSNEKKQMNIVIKDYGVGMSKEKQLKIFDLNEKTTTAGTLGETGTGFGLPYSQEIIKAHKGEITVSSFEDEGSEFTIHLPLFS
jgi:signal transduction histidine kinase